MATIEKLSTIVGCPVEGLHYMMNKREIVLARQKVTTIVRVSIIEGCTLPEFPLDICKY